MFGTRYAWSSSWRWFAIVTDAYQFNRNGSVSHWMTNWADHTWEFSQDWLYVDWTLKVTPSTATFTSPWPLYLFWLNNNWSFAESAIMKYYYFKIYDDWTLVRDFVPCYRKEDGEIWLRDKVNKVFYTNAGTGTFTKWADVVSYDFTQSDAWFSITEAHGWATTGRDSNWFYIVSGYSRWAWCRLQIPSTVTSMWTPKMIKVYGKNINNNWWVGISEGIDTNFIRAWGNAINISSSRWPTNSTSITALSEDVFVIDLENENCYMESSPNTTAVIYPSPILTLWNNSTLNLCILSWNKNSYWYLQKAKFYF